MMVTLLEWARAHGATLGAVRIGASGCGSGVGMYSTRVVQKGEELFSVPRALCITLGSVCADSCGASFAAAASRGQAMGAVASFVAKAYICGDDETAGTDGFAPYVSTLPLLPSAEHVLWWSEEELDVLEDCS